MLSASSVLNLSPTFRTLDATVERRWDATVAGFPEATTFHTAAWARVLAESYGYRPYYLALGEPEAPAALLPLFEVDSWLTGRRGIALPFTDACTILARDDHAGHAIWNQALALGRTHRWRRLELRDDPSWLAEHPASTSFYHHVLPLTLVGGGADSASADHPNPTGVNAPGYNLQTDDASPLFARFDPSVRRAIRKAQHAGLAVEIGTSRDHLDSFFQLLQLTRRRHGLPPQPRRFFDHIQRHLLAPGRGCIVLVRQGARPAAANLFLRFGRRAIYKFGASDERYQQSRASNLAMWEGIRWCRQQGCTTLDFGRTSLDNAGLRRFKLGWGTQESIVRYHCFDYHRNAFVRTADRSSGWHATLFRRLPLPLSRVVGEFLYRHIA